MKPVSGGMVSMASVGAFPSEEEAQAERSGLPVQGVRPFATTYGYSFRTPWMAAANRCRKPSLEPDFDREGVADQGRHKEEAKAARGEPFELVAALRRKVEDL